MTDNPRKIALEMVRHIVLSIVLASWVIPAMADPTTLRFYTTEEAPYNYTQGTEKTGVSVEILQAVLEKAGLAGRIEFLPWARSMLLVHHTKNTGLFSAARTPDREESFVWTFPLVSDKKRILAQLRQDTPPRYASLSQLLRNNPAIGVLRGDSREEFLRANGAGNLYPVSSHQSNLKRLMLRRVDMIATSTDELVLNANALGYSLKLFETAYVLFEGNVYLAMNRDTDQDVIDKLKAVMRKVTSDGSLRQIAMRWGRMTGIPFQFDPSRGIRIGDL